MLSQEHVSCIFYWFYLDGLDLEVHLADGEDEAFEILCKRAKASKHVLLLNPKKLFEK